MVKGIIFDADGTLWDSSYDILDSMNKALAKFFLPAVTRETLLKNLSYGARKLCSDTLDGRLDEEKSEEFLKTYNEIYTNCGSPKTELYNGVGEMLVALKDKGVGLALMSNKPQESLNPVYDKLLKKYDFDFVYGQRSGFKTKPDKSTTDFVLKGLGTEREETLFVGDSEIDFLTGKNAGLKTVSCLWGFRTKEFLKEHGATIFIEKPSELLEIIEKY